MAVALAASGEVACPPDATGHAALLPLRNELVTIDVCCV